MKYIISYTLRTVTNYTDGNVYDYITNQKYESSNESEAIELWEDLKEDDDYSDLMRNF